MRFALPNSFVVTHLSVFSKVGRTAGVGGAVGRAQGQVEREGRPRRVRLQIQTLRCGISANADSMLPTAIKGALSRGDAAGSFLDELRKAVRRVT